ncbi:MAG: hypothetical protein K2Y51_20185 [Gammaproteobacteria bacterium]|nr:hypothetical protein [Gammaproteobacteria bacterium]
MQAQAELHYKVRWRPRGGHPGHHPSTHQGGGLEFRHLVPLANAPDPRRFDVRASLRDPFGQIQVRVYQQTSAIPVFALVDLSASMRVGGARSMLARACEFVACLGYSAARSGDAFGLVACADEGSAPLYNPPSANPAAAWAAAQALGAAAPPGRDARGLLAATHLLGARRALVFLLSDFQLPLALVEQLLAALAHHDVVPVLLEDGAATARLPDWGLARVRDSESGQQRLILLRPGYKRRVREHARQRREALQALCLRQGRAPLVVDGPFEADHVTRYFLG